MSPRVKKKLMSKVKLELRETNQKRNLKINRKEERTTHENNRLNWRLRYTSPQVAVEC